MVVPCQDGSGHVHHLQVLRDHLVDGYLVVFLRVRILRRIVVIHAVHGLGQQDHIRFHLDGPKQHARIGGKIGMSGPSREKGDASRLHARYRVILGKKLRKGAAGKRRENSRLKPFRPAHLGYVDAVHDRGEHADLVRLRPVHVLAGPSPPEVPASDHNAHLDAALYDLRDLRGGLSHRRLIEAVLFISGESLPAQLQQYSAHNVLPFLSRSSGGFSHLNSLISFSFLSRLACRRIRLAKL